jgi:glycosyltransferase involved in cell wall biosynthesis
MGKQGKRVRLSKRPFVSVCMPTYNRRPFIPFIIKSFEAQTYPIDRMELIIIDDGTDKIEDLVRHLPYVKYFKYEEKMPLGRKRNLSHEHSRGEVIVYMDDDDYYPPQRVEHVIETLHKYPKALCVGSSQMYIYFNTLHKMYSFGPYGPNHATAATMAFRRELLNKTSFSNTACLAEEKLFLKDYTIPFAQLDPTKTILVFSHEQNTFDKRELLKEPSPYVKETNAVPSDFITDAETLDFFTRGLGIVLEDYTAGKIENKPDVLKQTQDIFKKRSEMEEKAQKQNKDINEFNYLVNFVMHHHQEREKEKEKETSSSSSDLV